MLNLAARTLRTALELAVASKAPSQRVRRPFSFSTEELKQALLSMPEASRRPNDAFRSQGLKKAYPNFHCISIRVFALDSYSGRFSVVSQHRYAIRP